MNRQMIEGCLQTIRVQMDLIRQVLDSAPISAEEKEARELADIGKVVRRAAEANGAISHPGRQKDPNSTMSQVFSFVAKLKSEGVSQREINQRGRQQFSHVSSGTLQGYLSKGYKVAA